MLYITSKDKNDVQTAYKVLHNELPVNSGCYLPFHLPCLQATQIDALANKSFGQIIADIMNIFYSAQLNGWDVDFSLGRNPVKIKAVGSKTFCAELWHNASGSFDHLAQSLYGKICNCETPNQPTVWFFITVRIAVLFAIYGALLAQGAADNRSIIDISLALGADLSDPAAVFYARKMGLPIGKVICACAENSAAWQILFRGARHSGTDMPLSFEALLHSALGLEGMQAFLQQADDPAESNWADLKDNIFVTTVGQQRVDSIIGSTYATAQYIYDTASAMAFGGLQDYRSSTGESRNAIVLMDKTPMAEITHITNLLGISQQKLSEMI